MDTAPHTGVDTAPDTGVDTAGDTASPAAFTLSGAVTLPEDTVRDAPLTAAAVLVRFGDGPFIGATLAAATIDDAGTFSLALPAAAPAGDPSDLGGPTHMPSALYALLAFEDTDGDGAWTEGEVLRGLAMDTWLAYTDGAWSLADLGLAGQHVANRCLLDTTLPLGWASDAGYPTWRPLADGVIVPLRGLPATLTVGGTVTAVPAGVTGLVALPYATVDTPSLAMPPAVDLPVVAGPFSALLTDAPPADQDYGADPDWRYTVHLLLLYGDADASGGWTATDPLDGATTCLDGRVVYARYTRPVTTYRGYRFLDCYDGTVGWRMARSDDEVGTVYLSSADARGLTVDPESCRAF